MDNWIDILVTAASLMTAVTVISDKLKKAHKKINQPEENATELAELKNTHKEDIKGIRALLSLLRDALLSILHDRLYFLCNFYIERSWISVEELKNLEHLYKGYSGLGGNGTGQELYERCCALPIKNKEGDV